MLDIAIVGLGGIGHTHARCYQANPRTRVAAVCDAIEEKAREAAARYGCPGFTSVSEMLKAGLKIDAASVCTAGEENGSHHFEPTMALLKAGIPVLGEKPISNRVEEAREMVKAARRRKIPYAINLNHRFTPAARRAREWLDQGRLGELHMIHMKLWINNPNESSPWFHMRALHPHSLDVMRYFAGDVKRVQAFFLKGKGRKTWSNAQINLQFSSGVIGHLVGSYDAGGSYGLEACEIVGSEGRVVIENACEKLVFSPRFSAEVETYDCLGGMRGFGETFQSRIDAWIEQLEQKTAPGDIDGKAEDALKAQLIIEAAIESWQTGNVITL
jgi:predicted dehydrogenase